MENKVIGERPRIWKNYNEAKKLRDTRDDTKET